MMADQKAALRDDIVASYNGLDITDKQPFYELAAHDGPMWEPGVRVDVVVQLRDASGRASRLRATKRLVEATF
jgi:hypothetical protein